jgi:hypothetical protein
MTKILCTGKPSHGGIAASLQKYYLDTTFISKETGYDLTLDESYKKFIEIIRNYDVFINHSQIMFGMQEQILEDVFHTWKENNIAGHIISIGSIIEFDEWQWLDQKTAKEKLNIRNTSLRLNSETIKTTHLIVSGFNRFDSEDDVKIDPDKIVEAIKFILEADFDVPLIYIDNTNDARLKKWRDLKSSSPLDDTYT